MGIPVSATAGPDAKNDFQPPFNPIGGLKSREGSRRPGALTPGPPSSYISKEPQRGKVATLKIRILYDNTAAEPALRADWGFSCLVETKAGTLLFDTGADGAILMENIRKMAIDPRQVDAVVISHAHFDHIGGLAAFLRTHPAPVYLPPNAPAAKGASEEIRVTTGGPIRQDVHTTGPLAGIEQSLYIRDGDRGVLVVGCAHPGLPAIFEAVRGVGPVTHIIGGLHEFAAFALLEGITIICPTHCTFFKSQIRSIFPDAYIEGGAGRIIDIGS